MCYEHPKNHPFISHAEKTYLQNQIENFDSNRKDFKSTPWKEMLHSSPVLALVFSTVSQMHHEKQKKYSNTFIEYFQALYSWSFYIVNTDLPKYLNDVLHVTIEDNSIYSSVPRISSIFVSICSGFLGDLMQTRCNINRNHIRKLFVILSEY